jgi:outer membrane scaffolding protein for murein synthesis (MipA/OmpV family)
MRKIEISKEPIELYKILKFENMVTSGGEAKQVILEGQVMVNGKIETRKRKKIFSGDIVEFGKIKIIVHVLSVIFVFCLMMPMLAFAELSNGTIVGPGFRWRPAYEGSNSQRVEFVPIVRYFGRPWFIRSTQGVFEGGVRMELVPGLYAGAQLAYESGRKSSESDFLNYHHVSDINIGASIGAQLEWDYKIGPMPLTLVARVRQHTNLDLGVQADLRFSAGFFELGPFSAGLSLQATWADEKSTSAFYAITPGQSTVTGLPVFDAGNGLFFGSIGLLWSFDLSRHWVVLGSIEARFLQGDAERSPLAERSTNYYVIAGLAYRF